MLLIGRGQKRRTGKLSKFKGDNTVYIPLMAATHLLEYGIFCIYEINSACYIMGMGGHLLCFHRKIATLILSSHNAVLSPTTYFKPIS